MGGVTPTDPEAAARVLLAEARADIDALDDQMVDLLVQRVAVVERVLVIKQEAGIPALLPERVEEVVERVCARARAAGLPDDLTDLLWRRLIQWTIDYENERLV